jgi:gamma-tubulin complex component 3
VLLALQVVASARLLLKVDAASKQLSAPANAASHPTASLFAAALAREKVAYLSDAAMLHDRVIRAANGSAEPLLLPDLALWIRKWSPPLAVLAALADAVQGLEGSALLASVHSLTRHGSPAVAATSRRVFTAAAVPVQRVLAGWLATGEIDDDAGEFFVRCLRSELSPDRLWRSAFLPADMVPPWLPPALLQRITVTGRTVAFIRIACGQPAFRVHGTHFLDVALRADGSGLDISDAAPLRPVVAACHEAAAARLVRLLHDDFHLTLHFEAVRDFLLLGDGEAADALLREITHRRLLEGPAADVPHHLLLPLPGACALDARSGRRPLPQCEIDVLSRLGIRLDARLSPEPALASGWDAFAVDLEVPPPISTVLTAEAMTDYRRIFSLLWSLRRAATQLTSLWQGASRVSQQLQRSAPSRASQPVLSALTTLLLAVRVMRHTVGAIEQYAMAEVIDLGWSWFSHRVQHAPSLDAIIAAHDDFLSSLLHKLMLPPAATGPNDQDFAAAQLSLRRLLAACASFASRAARFVGEVEAHIMLLGDDLVAPAPLPPSDALLQQVRAGADEFSLHRDTFVSVVRLLADSQGVAALPGFSHLAGLLARIGL